MFAPRGFQGRQAEEEEGTGSLPKETNTRREKVASAEQRADGPRLTPSPPGPTGHRATPAGGSRLGWSQCLPGGWWGMHQEGQSPVWMAHSLLAAPQGNSIRTGIFSLRGGRDRGTPCSSAAPGLTWRGVPWPLSAVGLRHQEGVCTALSLGGSWAGVTYCAGIASSSNRADQEIRKKSIPVPSP